MLLNADAVKMVARRLLPWSGRRGDFAGKDGTAVYLPAREWAVLLLIEQWGCSYRAAAQIMHTDEAMIRSLVTDARECIRDQQPRPSGGADA